MLAGVKISNRVAKNDLFWFLVIFMDKRYIRPVVIIEKLILYSQADIIRAILKYMPNKYSINLAVKCNNSG